MPSGYEPDRFKFGHYLPFPFFLASAAAYAERAVDGEHTVILRDSIARGESYKAFFDYVAGLKPDCLIVETGAASYQHDCEVLGHLKRILPNLRIAIAGPTAKTAHEAYASAPSLKCSIDAFLLGEFEKNAVDFIQGARGLLPFQMLTREELHKLPFPMFDEACALNYWDACPTGQQPPHLQLLTSRGCPYKCCFCAWPATMTGNDPDGTQPRSVRFYSPEWVEAFIRERIAKAQAAGTPLRSVYLDDDTFNLSDKHTFAICEVMKRIGLPWSAMCRADTSSPEAWQAMKDAGCFGVKLGIESISQRVVDEIVNKRLDVAKALETAKWLRSIGMSVHLTLTVGLPGETDAEKQATIDFARTCQRDGFCDTYQLSGTATIEGTPLDTLAKGESLKAYPGAQAAGFVRDADGVHKIETLTK
jgi:radical SAM superfamily enzyme YgiQ (UPF0313 family)